MTQPQSVRCHTVDFIDVENEQIINLNGVKYVREDVMEVMLMKMMVDSMIINLNDEKYEYAQEEVCKIDE